MRAHRCHFMTTLNWSTMPLYQSEIPLGAKTPDIAMRPIRGTTSPKKQHHPQRRTPPKHDYTIYSTASIPAPMVVPAAVGC